MSKTSRGNALLKRDIKDFLDTPDAIEDGLKRDINNAFWNQDEDCLKTASIEVLEVIKAQDPPLSSRFQTLSSHISCQASLVREVLREIWSIGPMATSSIPVVALPTASEPIPASE